MSSSIFEVKETESDSEKVLDFGLDSCEENGIVSVDGEVPKDHTYTKEPDVLQEDVMNDSDNSTTQPEEMGGISSSPVKTKSTRLTRNAKIAEKTKPKKAPVTKKAAAKKAKAKKDDITEEVDAISEGAGNGQTAEDSSQETAEEETKPAKRGRKRKADEKESTEEESSSEATDTKETKEKTPNKKKAKEAASNATSAKKGKAQDDANDTVIDTENLPPGWVRKSVTRKSGKTAGQIDVYIYSPDGIKFRSKPDVASYLTRTKSNLNIDDFDFSKKRILGKSAPVSNEPSKKAPKKKTVAEKPKSPVQKKAKAAPKKSPKAASPAPKKSPKPSPKKSPKLLVKIVSSKPKKSRATKESPAEETKSPVKGKATRGNKKKTNA